MQSILLISLVIVSVFLIALILVQHGKGADVGAAFGSGASQTIFGSQGTGSFLFRVTCGLAAVFFGLCLALNYLGSREVKTDDQSLALPIKTTTQPQSAPAKLVIPPATNSKPANNEQQQPSSIIPNTNMMNEDNQNNNNQKK